MHVLDEKQIVFVIISWFRNVKYLPMNIFFGRDLGGKAELVDREAIACPNFGASTK